MKKVSNVTIGQTVFFIEEDALKAISKYLDSLKKYYQKDDAVDEILEDIEISIAEKFLKKLKRKNAAVTLELVEEVIESTGTVADLKVESGKSEKSVDKDFEEEEQVKQKLYRDPDNKVVSGVCSGIANYFGIDPIWIRFFFFVSLFFGGFGFLLYLFFVIAVPEAKTSLQKFEMRGESATLKKIESKAKETLEKGVQKLKKVDEENRSQFKSFFAQVFSYLTSFLKAVVPVFRVIFGVILFLIPLLFLLTLSSSLVFLFTSGNLLFWDLSLSFEQYFSNWQFWVLILALFFVVAIPMIMVMILGVSLLRAKNKFSVLNFITLIATWFISIAVAAGLGFNVLPKIVDAVEDEIVNMEIVTSEYSFDDFEKLEISNGFEVEIVPAQQNKLVYQSLDVVNDDLKIRERGNELEISRKDKICFFCIEIFEPGKITLELKENLIEELELSGAAKVSSFGNIEIKKLDISGASKFTGELRNDLFAEMSGASQIKVNGELDKLSLKMSGASIANLSDLAVNSLNAKMSGASKGEFNVLTTITAELSGASYLKYLDYPNLEVKAQTSGGARLEKILMGELIDEEPIEMTFCTQQYDPVCGEVEINCEDGAECILEKRTFSNQCEANKVGAQNIVLGEC